MTDTARDVMARALWTQDRPLPAADEADRIMAALHAAGCRILAPGELDPVSAGLREAVGALYSCRYSELPLAKKLDVVLKEATGQSYHDAIMESALHSLKAKEAQDG